MHQPEHYNGRAQRKERLTNTCLLSPLPIFCTTKEHLQAQRNCTSSLQPSQRLAFGTSKLNSMLLSISPHVFMKQWQIKHCLQPLELVRTLPTFPLWTVRVWERHTYPTWKIAIGGHTLTTTKTTCSMLLCRPYFKLHLWLRQVGVSCEKTQVGPIRGVW